jgi:fluoroacetyl-CoA thioesterase
MASPGLQPGLKGQRETVVSETNIAPHVRKFSTPSMIRLMEGASSAAIEQHLPEGHVSVGFEVNIRHVAPADIGATVTAYSELLEVDRHHLGFKVEAYTGDRKIGEGTHRRTVISLNK